MHKGHFSIIKYIVKHLDFDFDKDEIIIVNGSANESRTDKNPFTWQERKEMVINTLKDEFGDKLKFRVEHINDYDDYMTWVDKLKKVVGRNKATIVGEDDVDYYGRLSGYKPVIVPQTINIHATQIREKLAKGIIPDLCPEPVRKWLKENNGVDIIKGCLKEDYFPY